MATQSIPLKYQDKDDKAGSLALIFFLLGAPHVYSFFKKRNQRKAETKNVLFWQAVVGLMGCGLVGTASSYIF